MVELQLPNYTYRATIVKVVDGDTVDVDLDVGFKTTVRKRLRFFGIDTWEVRGEEREKGLIAKARLIEMIELADNIYVQTVMDSTGKYGRVLAYFWLETDGVLVNVNDQLIVEGHGVPY